MTLLHGHSDDLFIIDGEIDEEIDCYSKQIKFTLSDGTKGTTLFTGEWVITIQNKGFLYNTLIAAIADDECHKGIAAGVSGYSDVLVIDNGITWINVNGKKYTV